MSLLNSSPWKKDDGFNKTSKLLPKKENLNHLKTILAQTPKEPDFQTLQPQNTFNKKDVNETFTNYSTINDDAGDVFHSSGKYSNYKNSYAPQTILANITPNVVNTSISNDKMYEKINQILFYLEKQQDEKTGNVAEEFTLYSLFGIFIIFVIDGFARNGRYMR